MFIPDPENEGDPYSEAVITVRDALLYGTENGGHMSSLELNTLRTLVAVLFLSDPEVFEPHFSPFNDE